MTDISDPNDAQENAKSTGGVCEAVWEALTSSVAPERDHQALGLPAEIAPSDIQHWLEHLPAHRVVDLTDPAAGDLEWLSAQGFQPQGLDSLTDEPRPQTGPAARRAVDLWPTSRIAQLERTTAFHNDMLREKAFVHSCPLSGRKVSAIAGFWLDDLLLAYFFHGERPFFVFLSTFTFSRTLVFVPALDVSIELKKNDWRSADNKIRQIRSLWVRRWPDIVRALECQTVKLAVRIGYHSNLAHSVRDELGGLGDIINDGYLDSISKVFVGPKQLWGPIESLFPEIPTDRIEHLNESEEKFSIQDRYLAGPYFPLPVYCAFLTRQSVERVAEKNLKFCFVNTRHTIEKARDTCLPLLSFTIRTGARAWVGQAAGIANIITSLARDYPNLGVVFDGVNDIASEQLIAEEKAVVADIRQRIGGLNVQIFDTIGVPLAESVTWALAIDAYVAPHGAGLVKQHFLGGKPGVVHSNHQNLGRVRGVCCDGSDIEGSNTPIFVGPSAVVTHEGSGENYRNGRADWRPDLDEYDCDWQALERLIRPLLQRADRSQSSVHLDRLRPGPNAPNRIHWLRSGRIPAVSLKADQRCSYGVYVPAKAIRRGVHDGVPIIVFVSGHVQTQPPYKMQVLADEVGAILFHPYFPSNLSGEVDESAYCHLESDGIRYDLLLLKMLDEFSNRFSVNIGRFYMCGGSGGAQFVHRFLLMHAEKVAGASVIAPASITRAGSPAPWWVGLADCKQRFGYDPDLTPIKSMPIQIVVGEEDLSETGGLSGRHWMDEAVDMGENRFERALKLVDDLRELGADLELTIVPEVGHSLAQLWEASFPFLQRTITANQ